MCENGRILHHLRNNLADQRNTVMIVGFMAKETLGRKLQEGAKIVNIFGDPVSVGAEIVTMDAFSGHADRSDLLDYISRIQGLKKIFLVHGEEEQSNKFKGYLAENGFTNVVQPAHGETIELP